MTTITCIEDLRVLAKKRVPRMFYDYADAGSWTESTYRANSDDFQQIKFRQRIAVNLVDRSLRSTMVGLPVRMPVALAPTGLTGMQHADGEILAAKAAEKFGVPFTLSTMSICSIEDVAANTEKPFWFQLYVMKDRAFIERLIDRAKAANCSALVLTFDLQVLGQRHKDIRNGLSAPPKPTIANILNLMTKPRWCLGMLGTRRRGFGNIVGHTTGVADVSSLSEWIGKQFDLSLSWADIEWVKKRWGGKLIVKGIMDPEDARLAVASGADAIVVSNHGGRQHQRHGRWLAQNRGRGIALGDVDQDALAELDRLHVLAVGAQRFLGIGAAVAIIEERLRHAALMQCAKIVDTGDVLHERFPARLASED